MTLVWKLLRRHISVPQFAGFALANLFGMLIVLLGYQFYRDVLPIFTSQDSFMKSDFLIVSKSIGAANSITGRSNSFNNAEIDELASQDFVKNVGKFTSTEYKVSANMGINGTPVINSELFFESVPNDFVDVSLKDWNYTEGSREVPIILPRSYINMYNFGFAQSHSLPKISDGLVGMIDFNIFIHGNGHQDEFKGRVIGFSNRLNTILVPQTFMDWANSFYAPESNSEPTRLIVEVANPADENIMKYFDRKGYEVDDDKLQSEKTTYFLRMLVSVVMVVGIIISILSFYILMLSIYLLVQKNTTKLENLLLIGYSPFRVALPYELLTLCLNAFVLVIALVIISFIRNYYMGFIENIFPEMDYSSMFPSILLGIILFILVSIINQLAIYRKVMAIWNRKETS